MSQVSSPKPVFDFSPKFRLRLSSYILNVLRPLVFIAEIRDRPVIDAYEAENYKHGYLNVANSNFGSEQFNY